MINRGAVIAKWRRPPQRRPVFGRNGVDRLAADTIVLTARQSLVGARRHALLIGADELELERRRTGVEHEDVHPSAPVPFVRRLKAARARARASSGVSPYA